MICFVFFVIKNGEKIFFPCFPGEKKKKNREGNHSSFLSFFCSSFLPSWMKNGKGGKEGGKLVSGFKGLWENDFRVDEGHLKESIFIKVGVQAVLRKRRKGGRT